MTSTVFTMLFGSLAAIYFVSPSQLSDSNFFLREFVSKDFIAFFGIFVSIVVSAAAALHVEITRFEEAARKKLFSGTRRSLRRSALTMGWLFVGSIVIVVAKHAPYFDKQYVVSFNAAAVALCLFAAWQLIDIINAIFILPAKPLAIRLESKGDGV